MAQKSQQLTLPQVTNHADTLSYLMSVRRYSELSLTLVRLVNARRQLSDEPTAEVLEARLTQMTEEFGLWLTNAEAPEPTWAETPTPNPQRSARFGKLPQDVRHMSCETAGWLWRDGSPRDESPTLP